jgi:hypothetical protein
MDGIVKCIGCGATIAVKKGSGSIVVNHKRRSIQTSGDATVVVTCERCSKDTVIVLKRNP